MSFAFLADIARAAGVELPGDIEGNQMRLSTHNIYFDCSKSHRELIEPEIDIVVSVMDTYQWYREHGYL